MPRFLSPEWMSEASAALAASDELAAATAGVHLRVQQVVTGGPDGDVSYVVALDGGRIELLAHGEPVDEVDIRLTVDWATAVAMSSGAVGAQEAFTTGRLRLGGDVEALLRHGHALAGLDTVFATLRARTTY